MHMLKTLSFPEQFIFPLLTKKIFNQTKTNFGEHLICLVCKECLWGHQNAPILSFVTNEWWRDQKKSFELFTIIKL